jgi:hypothetical protein
MEIPKGLLLSCGVLILTLGLQTTVGSAEVEMSPHLSAFAVQFIQLSLDRPGFTAM